MTNEEIREQIQENIITYIDSKAFLHQEQFKDDLCQIVVDCFTGDGKAEAGRFEDRYYYHPEEVFNRKWMNGKKC